MNINDTASQVELNKGIIQRYFEAYNSKNEAIFEDIMSPEWSDHTGPPGRGIDVAKTDLRFSLSKFDDINYTIEEMIASAAYPDLVGTYWKGSLTPNAATSETVRSSKIINYSGMSIYRLQNGKMTEMWHVIEGWPLKVAFEQKGKDKMMVQDTRKQSLAYSIFALVLVLTLATSLIAFPFQMIKVVEAVVGEENGYDINTGIVATSLTTANSSMPNAGTITSQNATTQPSSSSSRANNQLAIPEAAVGPTISPEKGYFVEEIRDGLYWITDGSYNTMFLVTDEGIVAIDAPPSIGANYLKAISEVTDKPITYVIYSHSHLDHIGAAASIFPENATYIAHEKVAEELQRAQNRVQTTTEADSHFPPAQLPAYNVSQLPPIPTETFTQNYTLRVGNQTLLLNYHGNNHEEGNIFIYAPQQRTLMLVDIIFPGWVPFAYLALAEDVYGYVQAHDMVLNDYDFDTFVGGHLTRLGTKEDVQIQRQFVTDLINASNRANQNVTFGDILQKVGGPTNNVWAIFNTYLDTTAEQCVNEMLPKWQHRLGGAEEFTFSHCWTMTESLRIEPTTKTLERQQQ